MMSSAGASAPPSKLGRPRQVEDEAVFAAMASVLVRVGWARLTLALVARELGITPAALRQRFGAKHGLFVAFYAWDTARLKASSRAPLDPERSPLEALRALIRGSVEPISTPEQMLNAMSSFTEVTDDPDLLRMAQERFELVPRMAAALLDRAAARGELAGIDPARLAHQLHVCLVGASLVWAMTGQRAVGDELLEVADLVLAPYLRPTEGGGTLACVETTD